MKYSETEANNGRITSKYYINTAVIHKRQITKLD